MIKLQEAIVTDHAYDRIKERMSLSKKAAVRLASKVLECGITHSEATGKLKQFLDKLYLTHKNGNNMRVYGQFVYLFKGSVLITVIMLEEHLVKISNKIHKRGDAVN